VKKFGTILGMLILATGLSSATTVTMQLTGFGPELVPGTGVTGPVTSGGVYTYPYFFSITAGSTTYTNVALLCDSYNREVWKDESWTADEVTLTSLAVSDSRYTEAAWLFSQITSNSNAAEYNWAIWGLFDPSIVGSTNYNNSGAASVLPSNSNWTSFDTTGFVVYVPKNPTDAMLNGHSVSNLPQEYIGYNPPGTTGHNPPPSTPEPASIVLLGSGLAAIGAKFRRNR